MWRGLDDPIGTFVAVSPSGRGLRTKTVADAKNVLVATGIGKVARSRAWHEDQPMRRPYHCQKDCGRSSSHSGQQWVLRSIIIQCLFPWRAQPGRQCASNLSVAHWQPIRAQVEQQQTSGATIYQFRLEQVFLTRTISLALQTSDRIFLGSIASSSDRARRAQLVVPNLAREPWMYASPLSDLCRM